MVRALDYVKREQEADGPWFGRWGVNYVYGTAAALPALAAIGEDMRAPNIGRACDWLVSRQQPNGGWGESCASYMNLASAGRGAATASQTAWALMALTAVNRDEDREAIERGCLYLIETQRDGTWDEPYYTGTGFPRFFYINYHLYRVVFPLSALGRYCEALEGAAPTSVVQAIA